MQEILCEMNTKLRLNVDKQPDYQDELSPKVKALRGKFKLLADFDYKKEVADAITRKYLTRDKEIH
jgi:hypothetical protein